MTFDRNGLVALERHESLELLRSAVVGRVLVTEGGLPMAFPVNYALLGDDIVFRSDGGTKLRAAGTNAVVGFQVDDFDVTGRGGWSVLVTGHASEIEDPSELEAAEALLDSWVPGHPGRFVKIRSQLISGRRLRGAAASDARPAESPTGGHRVPWAGPALGGCPSCGWVRLLPVNDGELANFPCPDCGACWHVDRGRMHRVDPPACPGCRFRGVCTHAYLADALKPTAGQ
jgi:hypothetical protein